VVNTDENGVDAFKMA
jgi:hypothetical protein